MARWKLTHKHYLNVPGVEWEYSETDAQSGTVNRKRFAVGKYLDPDSPRDWTDKTTGEIIVCHEGKGARGDLTFVGPPTPDMDPLDDEAQAISDALKARWSHPIESLPATGDYSQSLINSFEKQMRELTSLVRGTKVVENTTLPSVSVAEFEQLKAQMAQLIEQNAALQTKVDEKTIRRA